MEGNAVKEGLKDLPGCPYYESGKLNAVCRVGKEGEWISGSKDTEEFCQLHYKECQRYEKKMGIEDEEYKQLNKEYFRELLGEEVLDEGIENSKHEAVATKRGMDGLEDLSFLLGID